MTHHAPETIGVPDLPGRVLDEPELRAWVERLAARPELWRHHVAHDAERGTGSGRHYVSLHRDEHVDVWLLCWDTGDDTGWHDHDTSAGAVVVTEGAVVESRPRLGGEPATRTVPAGRSFAFGPDHIHRMSGAVDGSVSIHAYSPPLWRMGQYAISDDGVMRRWSVSYADELRPVDA
ncbi:cysteine dioxygenase family protein [Nocardioides sp. CFH 31398]|uniref:cysteine dioxygenase n=1 Tax=Nocardioides sp. CFH 31398 TaxID=2919579 RepID=UPI001F052FE1|nr:cysteine dioxygenase family protein [Nocardioides sp. CFH 31398]MCH1864993.1 cysteine dioxygenase family protein [Nocardioides sp. CFH 31398]